jgi:hypothetical protein
MDEDAVPMEETSTESFEPKSTTLTTSTSTASQTHDEAIDTKLPPSSGTSSQWSSPSGVSHAAPFTGLYDADQTVTASSKTSKKKEPPPRVADEELPPVAAGLRREGNRFLARRVAHEKHKLAKGQTPAIDSRNPHKQMTALRAAIEIGQLPKKRLSPTQLKTKKNRPNEPVQLSSLTTGNTSAHTSLGASSNRVAVKLQRPHDPLATNQTLASTQVYGYGEYGSEGSHASAARTPAAQVVSALEGSRLDGDYYASVLLKERALASGKISAAAAKGTYASFEPKGAQRATPEEQVARAKATAALAARLAPAPSAQSTSMDAPPLPPELMLYNHVVSGDVESAQEDLTRMANAAAPNSPLTPLGDRSAKEGDAVIARLSQFSRSASVPMQQS